MFDYKS